VDFFKKADFMIWAEADTRMQQTLDVMKWILHINIGLPPAPQTESLIIEHAQKYYISNIKVNDIWFVISKTWWDKWYLYTTG
jgi:hypothetical protein